MLSNNRNKFKLIERAIGKNLSFVSPHSWTLISLIFAGTSAAFISKNHFLIGALFFSFAAFCDAIDGAVARFKKSVSSKGAYIDTIVDRYVDFFIIAGLFCSTLPSVILDVKMWLLIYLFGSVMTTYSKAAAKEKDLTKMQMETGFIQRAERLILLFIGLILAAFNPILLTYIIILLSILTNITALQRVHKALQR